MKPDLFDIIAIIGLALVCAGLWFITPIAAALFCGLCFMAYGIFGSR